MKYLMLLALAAVLWWVWSKRRETPPAVAPERPVERMVSCAHCGVHLPESDALKDGKGFYCSQAHRQAAGGGH